MTDAGRLIELFKQAWSLTGTEREAFLHALREEEPAMADSLAGMFEADTPGLTVTHPFAARLEQEYGAEANPQISLDEEIDGPDFASDIVERLAGRGEAYGRYRLKGEVARGGQGAILRVWDEDLRRSLAMKVILNRKEHTPGETPSLDSRTLGRFLEEAQVTGQLDHPGIVPVHELGLDDSGQVYFTMKFVKGRDLRAIFAQVFAGKENWTTTRALNVLLKVCEAMAYAHDKGVIHRDLKPANIMVGRYGEVYVMDWGLAKIQGREDDKDVRVRPEEVSAQTVIHSDRQDLVDRGSDSPLYTMDGDVVGTPAYMPPEQASGRTDAMGPHSDVYALGAMLYHLLAGHMPFVPPDAKPSNYLILRWVTESAPASLETEAPDAPQELVAICEKAMQRDPAQRYSDMSELATDLSAYLEGRVVRAYETGAWAEARKWVRRNKPLAAALAAAVVIALGGLGGTGYVQAKGRAVAEGERARADERSEEVLSLSALQEVEDLVREAGTLWPVHSRLTPQYEDWIRRARELSDELEAHEHKLAELQGEQPTAGPSSRERRWWLAQQSKVVEELRELESGLLAADAVHASHGWSIPKRLAHANTEAALLAPGGDHARRWERDLPLIHEDYPDLELTPQRGLVPIGRDPGSGLWEFWHVASGEEPRRDEESDSLELTEESGIVFILVPGATFDMGASAVGSANVDIYALPNEAPVHPITLAPYFLSKYEMTQGQWLRLAGNNPSDFRAGLEHTEVSYSLLHPVEMVSWGECRDVLSRVDLGLPTEAQWEFAARAYTSTPWWTGARMESLEGNVNIVDQAAMREGMKWAHIRVYAQLEDGHPFHAAADAFPANRMGFHHVIGNVWEWCEDPYTDYEHPVLPGTGERVPTESKQRVVRGGSYRLDPTSVRTTMRFDISPEARDNTVGLRPARAVAARP